MYKLQIPFYAFKLHLHSGGSMLVPLSDEGAIRIGEPLHLTAGKYAELLQRQMLNQGRLRQLLEEYHEGDFYRRTLSISFPHSRENLDSLGFDIEFDYFVNPREGGLWAVLPVLGIESFAADEAQLARRLEEAVKLEFARKKRLQLIQRIVSCLWYDQVELKQHQIELQAPTPSEVEQSSEEKQEALLPQVAQPLSIHQQVVYGRDKELDQIFRALKGKFGRNLLLVGPSGVGKTALVWELARQRSKKRIKGRIWETTASFMIKELMRNTGWQDNLSRLCAELAGTDDILFVRNLMELFEVGKYEGNEVSVADYLRNSISRGEVTLISECTEEELARIDLKSPNYLAFFQVIRVGEPEEELETIILNKVRDLAGGRKVQIGEEAIREIIRLNRRFTPYSGMPGKPIRFLESILINKKREAAGPPPVISRSEVIRYFCEDTGMPAFMVDPHIPIDIRQVKTNFNEMVFGQERAVESVVDLLASVKTALTRTGKPIASFLFVGPTGVGKTELAKILAEFMFGRRERLVRFDMSEYSSPFSVMRLTGIDYFSDGLLTSAIRREPFCVLLFDEIEKAHPNFFDLLLQILSEGRLTDSQGKLVNFCSTIIIMTSNIGADTLRNNRISWNKKVDVQAVIDHFMSEVQKRLRPELFNRIDQVIPFEPLDQLTVRFVVEREVALLREREGIRFRRMDFKIADEVFDYLADKGYDSKYGARHLQRTIRENLIIPLAKALNAQDYDDQLIVKAWLEKDEIHISVAADPLGLELLIEELDKINHADLCGALRRKISRILEGHVYIQLLSEIDLMEHQKKRGKKTFWENKAKAERYARFLAIREHAEALSSRIAGYEMDLCLSCMELHPYSPSQIEQVKQWEEELFQLKVNLVSNILPEMNTCHLSIYGIEPRQVADFYFELLARQGYEYSVYSVWFREKYYNEEVSVSDSEGAKKIKREGYVKLLCDMKKKDPYQAEEKGDLLCGVEITLSGPCAHLFLKAEEGVQRWKLSNQSDHYYVVMVENKAFATPAKIHRQEFYRRQSPRRIIDAIQLRDTTLKIAREYRKDELVGFFTEQLDLRFRGKLDEELI